MSANTDPETASSSGYDPSIKTENIAFDLASMVSCSACSRNNPPTRLKCLYCGNELEIPIELTAEIKTDLRQLEAWELGTNVIFRSLAESADLARAATVLSLDRDDLVRIVEAGNGIPVARVEGEREATVLIEKLGRLGFQCFSLTDDVFSLDKPNVRINAIDILPGQFGVKDFNTSEITRFAAYEIALIVEGVINKTKIDSVEKWRIRGESKLIDQSMIVADDRVLDIYPIGQSIGYRLSPTGFDFSCLGDKKSMLARENWGRLINLLKDCLPSVQVDDSYIKVREALSFAWPVEARNETRGMIQTGFGKREFGSVATTSNLEQFNRYSRLQKHLL